MSVASGNGFLLILGTRRIKCHALKENWFFSVLFLELSDTCKGFPTNKLFLPTQMNQKSRRVGSKKELRNEMHSIMGTCWAGWEFNCFFIYSIFPFPPSSTHLHPLLTARVRNSNGKGVMWASLKRSWLLVARQRMRLRIFDLFRLKKCSFTFLENVQPEEIS